MVDAQAIDPSFNIKPKDRRVNPLENLIVFLADRSEIVDVEEAPPINLIIARTPPREPIMLCFQQAMDPLAAGGSGGIEPGGRLAFDTFD